MDDTTDEKILASASISSTSLGPPSLDEYSLAPTSLAPTNLAPTSLAPTSLAPTNLAPISLAPTSLAPTIDEIGLLYKEVLKTSKESHINMSSEELTKHIQLMKTLITNLTNSPFSKIVNITYMQATLARFLNAAQDFLFIIIQEEAKTLAAVKEAGEQDLKHARLMSAVFARRRKQKPKSKAPKKKKIFLFFK